MTHKELGFVKAAMANGLNQNQALQCLKVANFPPHQDPHGAPQQHQGAPPQHGGMGGGMPKPPGGAPKPPGGPQPHAGGGEPVVTVDGQPLPPELAKIVLQVLEQVAGGGQGGAPGGGQHPGM